MHDKSCVTHFTSKSSQSKFGTRYMYWCVYNRYKLLFYILFSWNTSFNNKSSPFFIHWAEIIIGTITVQDIMLSHEKQIKCNRYKAETTIIQFISAIPCHPTDNTNQLTIWQDPKVNRLYQQWFFTITCSHLPQILHSSLHWDTNPKEVVQQKVYHPWNPILCWVILLYPTMNAYQ